MYDIGDFIEYLADELTLMSIVLPIIRPGVKQRPNFPYLSIAYILSDQRDIYQIGVDHSSFDITNNVINEVITVPRRSQFSLTVIGEPNKLEAETNAQTLLDLIKSQATLDWFRGRGERILITRQLEPRYVIEDNFNEERVGFDIEIRDLHEITPSVGKETIDTVTMTDTSGKVDTITVMQESGS